MPPHPFEALSTLAACVALGTLIVATAAVGALVQGPFRTPESPQGVLSLELAWSPERAERVLRAWRGSGALEHFPRHLAMDNLWIPLYASMLAMGCVVTGGVYRADIAAWAGTLAWAMWLAGALDLAENALLARVARGARTPFTQAAAVCAGIKIVLLLAGAAYSWLIVLLLVPLLQGRLAGRRRSPVAGAG